MENKILTVRRLKKKIYANANGIEEDSVTNAQANTVTVTLSKVLPFCVTKADVEAEGVSEDYEISAPSGYADNQLIPDVTLEAKPEITIQDNIRVHCVDENGDTVLSDTVIVSDSHTMKVSSSFVKNYPSGSLTVATDWLNYFKTNKLYDKIVSQFKDTHASDISTADAAAPTIDGYTLSSSSSNEAHNAGVLNNLDGSRTPLFANSYVVTHEYTKNEEVEYVSYNCSVTIGFNGRDEMDNGVWTTPFLTFFGIDPSGELSYEYVIEMDQVSGQVEPVYGGQLKLAGSMHVTAGQTYTVYGDKVFFYYPSGVPALFPFEVKTNNAKVTYIKK